MSKVCFIGLGNMGGGMCANLSKAGFDVHAYDLDADAVKRAVQAGAIGHSSLKDAAIGADIVISMLPAGKHVRSVYLDDNASVDIVSGDALFIDCSTIAVEDARAISAEIARKGCSMVDAPVSGGTAAAEAGSLTFMVGGEVADYDRAKPYLSAMGKNIFLAGGIGNGQAAKIANNMLLAISMIGTCEAFNLAQKLGLDAQTFYDISSKASGQNWSMTSYCPAPGPVSSSPANREYAAGFAVAMMLKDLNLAHGAAQDVSAMTPLGDHARQIYDQLSEDGFAGLDFSGVMKRIQGAI